MVAEGPGRPPSAGPGEKSVSQDFSPPGPRPLSVWREAAFTVAAGGLVAAFCGLFLLQDPLFFWHDDYQRRQP